MMEPRSPQLSISTGEEGDREMPLMPTYESAIC